MPPAGSLLVATQFLTRLPGPARDASAEQVGESIGWFPVVGLGIGALLVVVNALASRVLAAAVVDALLIAFLVAVTGALHLDGLIDTVDGLSVGPDASARLAAMRQSTASVPGSLAGCAMLIATFAALASIDGAARPTALLLGPTVGRVAIVLGYRLFPYPRSEPGVSQSLKQAATTPRAAFAVATLGALAAALAGPHGVLLVAASLAAGAASGWLMMTRVPGVTGDGQGAICEVTQLATLVLAPAILAV